MLSGAVALAETPTLSQQLVNLGRQATARGKAEEARSFYRNALKLDPANAEARAALGRSASVRLVALQDPGDPLPAMAPPADGAGSLPGMAPPADGFGPIEDESALERQARFSDVARQAFVTDVRQRLQAARDQSNGGNPEGALQLLRDALTVVSSSDQIAEPDRRRLENEVRNQIGAAERVEERTYLERAEKYRIYASTTARSAALDRLSRDQDTTNKLMTEFDSLMAEGNYRVLAAGGLGDINTVTMPYVDARFRAQAARAMSPDALAPWAGMFTADATGFLAQSHAFDLLKEYRAMLTFADVDRSAVPFNDTRTIEYPERAAWQAISEKRILRYGNADYLFDRDDQTKAILSKLNEKITMSFPNETPFEDIQKYIQQSTQDEAAGLPTGIPIYVDPQGLIDSDKLITSPVSITSKASRSRPRSG